MQAATYMLLFDPFSSFRSSVDDPLLAQRLKVVRGHF